MTSCLHLKAGVRKGGHQNYHGQLYGQVFCSKLLVYNDFNRLVNFPNEFAYHYEIKDRGGNWVVEYKD